MASAVPLTPVRANQQRVCNESGCCNEVKTPGLVNNVMCKDFDKESRLDVDGARNATTPVRINDKHTDKISGSSSSHVVNEGVGITSTPVSNEIGDYSSRVRTPALPNNVMCEDFLVTPGVHDDKVRDSHHRHSFCTPGGKSKARPQKKLSKDKDCKDRSNCSTPTVTAGYKCNSGEGSILRGAKRSLSELFSSSPVPSEGVRIRKHLSHAPPSLAIDKGTAASIWTDASNTKRTTAVEGEADVSDDVLHSSNSNDICVVELLLNSKCREGIKVRKSWRLGDLKRRLVQLGYFGSDNLITIKTRFLDSVILPDDRTIGDLDKNDVIVVECV